MEMPFVQDDGGRAAARFKGDARDCVARAIAVASGRLYEHVYEALAEGTRTERKTRKGSASGKRTAREGIHTSRLWFKDYMANLGFFWVPTMQIGSGCKVHLTEGELPAGRLVVAVSRHYTAVIDGVIHDTYDPQRPGPDNTEVGRRCVYGYWKLVGEYAPESRLQDGPVLPESDECAGGQDAGGGVCVPEVRASVHVDTQPAQPAPEAGGLLHLRRQRPVADLRREAEAATEEAVCRHCGFTKARHGKMGYSCPAPCRRAFEL